MMWVCVSMALLCIPVPGPVSCTFSTIPICPFLIQRIFSFTCLHSFFTCIQQITCSYMLLCGLYQQLYQQLYLPVLKYTSQNGQAGIDEATNSGALPHKEIMCLAGSRSVLRTINAGSITLHDGIVSLMWDYRLIYG